MIWQTLIQYLIPPFIFREAGLTVNDTAKIHCGDTVTEKDHTIRERDTYQ